jgi:hypothetical protein
MEQPQPDQAKANPTAQPSEPLPPRLDLADLKSPRIAEETYHGRHGLQGNVEVWVEEFRATAQRPPRSNHAAPLAPPSRWPPPHCPPHGGRRPVRPPEGPLLRPNHRQQPRPPHHRPQPPGPRQRVPTVGALRGPAWRTARPRRRRPGRPWPLPWARWANVSGFGLANLAGRRVRRVLGRSGVAFGAGMASPGICPTRRARMSS